MIEKKREMKFIQQMINEKKKECTRLEEYNRMRKDGLTLSENMLSEDIRRFIQYFQENHEEAGLAAKEADQQQQIRMEKV